MIRRLLLLLALAGLAAAAPAGRDWTHAVRRTVDGAFVQGNPAARVKLVEYVSYTCPHCAHFRAEAGPTLDARFVRSGSTSVELHNQIHDPLDLAAAVLARCSGARFFELTDAIYVAQPQWYARGADYLNANQARLALYPALARLRAYADGAGLTGIARDHGLSAAGVDACFASDADMNRILAASEREGAEVPATPGLRLNGRLLADVYTWDKLLPLLRAAGAH